MKKISFFVLFIVTLLINLNVSALTSNELKEKILGEVEVSGKTYTLSDEQKVIVERYFRNNTIVDSDATYIGSVIDNAISIVKSVGHVNFSNYPTDKKNELKNLVLDISSNTAIKATLTKDGLTVQNMDGSIVVIDGPIKQTGYNGIISSFVLISLVVATIGFCLIIKQIRTGE